MNAKLQKLISIMALIPLILASVGMSQITSNRSTQTAASSLLQFTSGGHVLGFEPQGVYAATGSHALRVDFVCANNVQPEAEASAASNGQAAPLSRVAYADLWEGIRLEFSSLADGIYTTTYTLAPGAKVKDIRLRYNTPVTLNANGTLTVAFERGSFTESAPIAWQEIHGKRVSVDVAFRVRGQEVSFALGNYNPNYALVIDPSLVWNTFLGGSGYDSGEGITVDSSGNSYVVGTSDATWGSPVRGYSGLSDVFVAKLNSSGALVWSTFLGAGGNDTGKAIVEVSGEVYVIGYSYATWGSPVRAYTGGVDAFVAKVSSSGALVWNTFLGAGGNDYGKGISKDGYGNLYVTGSSNATWGIPKRAYTSGNDAYAAKLSSTLVLIWNTFLGGTGADYGEDIAALSTDAIYVTGYSAATWGSPVRAYASAEDAFVVLLDGAGVLTWNSFLGGSGNDHGHGIEVRNISEIYVAGDSTATWGSPLWAYTAGVDAYVARLGSSGALTWNTFLGGSGGDTGYDLAMDGSGNLYVTGFSDATWGSPLQPYAGLGDAYAAKLNSSGARSAITFLGGSEADCGNGIAVDSSRNPYVTGYSGATWGSPVRAYSALSDGMVAKADLEAPTITSIEFFYSNPTNRASVLYVVHYSEPVNGALANDFGLYTTGVSGASITNVSDSVTGESSMVTINTGSGNGTIHLRVMGWADIYDLGGNPMTGLPYMSGPTYTVDKTAPSVVSITRADPNPTTTGSVNFTVAFSEAIQGEQTGHFALTTTGTISGASVTGVSGSGTTRIVTVNTGSGSGTLRLDIHFVIPPIRDLAGNALSGLPYTGGQAYDIDKTAPTVTMSSPATDPTSASPVPVTVQFSETVTGFIAGDIIPGNGMVGSFTAVDGDTYTFNLTPSAQGSVTADIAAGVATDLAGNGNTAAAQFSRTYDSVTPTVTMTSAATNPTNTSPVPVTVQFSETVTGFVAGDIIPGDGTVSNFTAVDGDTYTFDLTPSGQGPVTANIAADVTSDSAGNGNTAAAQFSRTYSVMHNLFLPLVLR